MTKLEERKLRKAIDALDNMYAEKSYDIEYIRYFFRGVLSTSNDDELEDFIKTELENQDTPFIHGSTGELEKRDLLTLLSNIQSLLDNLNNLNILK